MSEPTAAAAPWLDKLGLHRPELRAWALYDVANSAWMTTILLIFPLYFVNVAAAGMRADVARSRFAFVTSLSVVLVGLMGPVLGTMADFRGNKKGYLGAFLALGATATAAMYWITEGRWVLALLTFVIGNVGVTSTLAFYNALLPGIASADEVDRVSTAGFALGYLGGGLLMALNAVLIAHPELLGLPDKSTAIRLSFLSVAVWWGLFSIPLFLKVKEPKARESAPTASTGELLRLVVRRLAETIRDLRRHRDAGLLLLAFLLYNDGINTIIRMATTFGDEIGIPQTHMIGALLVVQFVGIPFAFAFGLLAGSIGAKRAILLALLVYSGIGVYGYTLRTSAQFFVLAFLVGTVQGGAQGLSRSLFATMIPAHKAGEMFGFFGVFDRFGGALGSLLFGLMLSYTGSSRPAILSLIVLFLVGGFFLTRVDVERGRRVARDETAAAPAVAS
ncbi:MAG TPA: MFS transporter [Vicinamibacteria bacterium]|nr:MFS transporter [Vicinamibacteria bacterium]